MPASDARFPTLFLPHGGGPWPLMDGDLRRAHASLEAYLGGLDAALGRRPRAIVLVSAHWDAARPTVNAAAAPGMLYDYGGFPEATYRFVYPAPGSPAVAARVRALLTTAGVAHDLETARGYDHGVFVPLMVAYPDADVPIVEVSLRSDLDPAAHLALGRALAPLRDEDVLIAGSGMSFHNMRGFLAPSATLAAAAARFDAWLARTVGAEPSERDAALATWAAAPDARTAHPTEEHLMPLLVAAGAAGDDRGTRSFEGTFSTMAISGFRFG